VTHTAQPGDEVALDWIEVPLDTAPDRSRRWPGDQTPRLSQFSVTSPPTQDRRSDVAELLRLVAERLGELGEKSAVHDITFGTDAGGLNRMTVYYE
jgi:hypothetical protein